MSDQSETLVSLNARTATEIRVMLSEDRCSVRDVVTACLERIRNRDVGLRAWLAISDDALAQADRLDALPKPKRGRLHGLPVGVKDVFDTVDMPTTHNSPIYEGFRPAADAPSVDLLRSEGAVILGKTDTTEFAAAGRDAASGNPHDLSRTPGGSSSGSAAAVADCHVPLALGTQTGGSTIRPASFCGIYGFKPTFGRVSREGVKIYANSLDTVGWYGRSLADIALLADVYGLDEDYAPIAGKETLSIAFSLGPYESLLEPEMLKTMEAAAARLTSAGHTVSWIALPDDFEPLDRYQRTILWREGAAAFRNLAHRCGSDLHQDFYDRVDNRAGNSLSDWRRSYDDAARLRVVFDDLACGYDLVCVPSAPGIAPFGRKPGNPVFNAMWTLLGVPCLNVPVRVAGQIMPAGVTLTAPRFTDSSLLAFAQHVANDLEFGNAGNKRDRIAATAT